MIYRLSKQLNKVQILIGAILSFAFLALGAYFFLAYAHAKVHDLSLEAMQISEGEDGELSYSFGGISLPKGEYELSIGYLSDGVCNLAAHLDNDGQTRL